MVALRKSKR